MLMQNLLEAAKAKLSGFDGIIPNLNYTKDVNPQYDPRTKYYLKGTYKDEKGDYVGDHTPLPRRYAEMPEPDLSGYEQKPFKTNRETLEEYMNRISVSDIPENLLVRDGEGRIIGMVQPPKPTYVIPDRRGSQFFAP